MTPDYVRSLHSPGYTVTEPSELTKLRIFHVTPEYIRTMRSRGLKDFTIEKLVRMRIAGIT